MRTASPFIGSSPRQAWFRASFRLAPPSHHEAFRPPGVRDARCVRPTSATQSNCVYPYLVRSRPAHAIFTAGAPHGVFGSMRYCRGKGSFTPPASASVDRSGHNRGPRDRLGSASLRSVTSRWPSAERVGVVFPPRLEFDRASDTPVASPSSDQAESPSWLFAWTLSRHR